MYASRFAQAAVVVLLLTLPLAAQTDTITALGHWEAGSCMGHDIRGLRAYHGNGCLLEIVDITNPAAPEPLGRILLPARIDDVVVAGNLAYVADSYWGLQIVDITDSTAPFLVGSLNVGTRAAAIAIDENHVYLVDTYEGLRIIDVADPTAPVVVQHLDPEPFPQDVVIVDDRAYLSAWNGIFIYDVADPTNSIQLSVIPDGNVINYEGITVRDDIVYAAARQGGLHVWDVSDPLHPEYLDHENVADTALDVDLHGDLAVVTCYHGNIVVVNVAKPRNLATVGGFHPPGPAYEILCRGGLAYVAASGYGLRIIDLADPTKLEILSTCPVGGQGVDLEVRDGIAHVAEANGGLRILDVTDPHAPSPIGYLRLDEHLGAIALQGDLACAAGRSGLRIFDISDPAAPQSISFFATEERIDDIAVHDDLVCCAIAGTGLLVLDISDPVAPRFHGLFEMPGGQFVVMDERYAYFPVTDYYTDLGGVYILDHTVPGTPPVVGRYESWKAMDIAIGGERVYFYGRGDGNQVGLVVLDVADPTLPEAIGFLEVDWPLTTISTAGDYLYFYQMFGDNLLAVDVSDPANLHTVAEFERPGWHAFSVQAIDGLLYVNGVWVLRHDTVTGFATLPTAPAVHLAQNVPNPFNPATTIEYRLPTASPVRIEIFDLRGRLVRSLRGGERESAGRHAVTWDGRSDAGRVVAAGVYLYRLEAGTTRVARRMMIVR